MKNENYEHVKGIALELEDIVNGYYKNVNGEPVKVETDDNGYNYLIDDNGDIYCETGSSLETDETFDLDDLEDYTVYDYFSDCFDIQWTLNSDFTYKAVRIMVACGGPNIYINTLSGDVELYWWTDSERYPMSTDVINAIDEYFEEYYECCRR